MNRIQQAPRAFVAALYVAVAYLVVSPFLYESQRLLPADPTDFDWRFGAEGFILTAVTTPLIGLALGTFLAYLRGDTRGQRVLAWTCLALVVVLVVIWVGFLVDLQSMVRSVPAEAIGIVKATAFRSAVGAATAIIALLGLSIGGFRAAAQVAGSKQ
jgi:hypothetical protein